ncbi:acyl-CoA-binding domain-containing protein 6 [Parasteatoda tepidariorum]|uniref:acyl-CoA-binding domain-containing protein 6 n=1 Tax=Parasteatoda tepidariorum TaxID=114398 RepID=UPI00077F89EB|nr:acyl-CoA-binding domain-containing protein 6-like [Parasteatoda tepidariorum]
MEETDFAGDENSVEETFQRAIDFVTGNASVMQQDDLLYLYGRYKQALCGPCKEPMPGILKFKSRSKWTSWHNLGNMSKEEAMQQYIDCVTNVSSDWDSNPKESAKKSRIGPVNSSYLKTDPEIKEELKTAFDFVKEGNLNQIKLLLSSNSAIKDSLDENGLTLLHWACDRGHVEIANYLVSSCGIDVDCQDTDGQTPLHYASSCGHEEVINFLLKNGASVDIYDVDGLSPADVAYNTSIKEILLNKHV